MDKHVFDLIVNDFKKFSIIFNETDFLNIFHNDCFFYSFMNTFSYSYLSYSEKEKNIFLQCLNFVYAKCLNEYSEENK